MADSNAAGDHSVTSQITFLFSAYINSYLATSYCTVWYKTKFGSRNFDYQIWCLFGYIYNVFQNYVQYESNDNVIIYYGSVTPHDWDVSFKKNEGLPIVVAFWEN